MLRWKMVPEIIAHATLRDTQAAVGRHDNIVAFHWLETTVQVGERVYRVGVNVAEDSRGQKFYNLNEDLEAWRARYGKPLEDTRDPKHGAQGAEGESEDPTFNQNVAPQPDGINLTIFEQGTETLHKEEGRRDVPAEGRTPSGTTQPVPTFSRNVLGAGLEENLTLAADQRKTFKATPRVPCGASRTCGSSCGTRGMVTSLLV